MSINASFLLILFTGAYFGSSKGLQPNRVQVENTYEAFHESLASSNEPEMIWVEGGTFSMGSDSGETDERPIHAVELDGYYIGKYEIMQAQWSAVMGNNPSTNRCDRCPVENVSWNEVQEFVGKLNVKTGKAYRLPTEAEWEYAARGGNKSRNYTYSGSNDIYSVAWVGDNSDNKTRAVGTKLPNELCIYDMSGNVWEWCSDWYGTYNSNAVTDPKGPYSGEYRVGRGGSWDFIGAYCRSANRNWYNTDNRNNDLGFRLALSPVQ
jgi:formylglycine-generating enzyme required for sulfatase activity